MAVVNAVTGKQVDPTIMSALSEELTVTYAITIAEETVTKWGLQAPIYNRIMSLAPPKIKKDAAAVYAILTSADFEEGGGAAFAAGGDPYSIDPQRSLTAVTKKSYGVSGGIKDIDIVTSSMPGAPISINMEKYANDAEMLLALLLRRTLMGIDYDMIRGSVEADANAFDGIETKVVSGTSGFYMDKAGGTALTSGLINQHISWMMAGGENGKGNGPIPTAIYCHPVIHLGIVNAYEDRTKASINIIDGKEGVLGLWATRIVTPAGEIPIVSDPRFSITSDGTNVTGSVFFAVEFHNGVQILYPEWMIWPTAVPLSKVMGRGRATSTELAVWSHLCLVERTNWWAQGCLDRVTVAFTPTVTSSTE